MSGRYLALFAAAAVVLLGPVQAAGQTSAAAESGTASRTPWGDPDLQGTWTNTTRTPLERPTHLGATEVYTEEQVSELNEQAARNVDRPPPPGETGAYNSFWMENGERSRRTSLVVDPPDGRVPYTPRERERADAFAAAINADGAADTWTDRNLYERCITRGLPGTMMPGFYNHNYHILQAPGYVVIYVEMIHDARIVPLDGRAHVPASIRQWLGSSRGRWEGDTLVVETTNFTDAVHDRGLTVFGGGRDGRLVERFTRVDADTIDYEFTFDDSTVFTRPWTAAIPMTRMEGPLFEYACHEGNYGLENILAGARAEEQAAAAAGGAR